MTDWYDANAEHFAQRTLANDMSDVYRPFLELLPAGGHILDAGCGPGRDAKAFCERGFHVTAFDASPAMVALCTRHASIPALQLRFHDVNFEAEFDGVWACASLLHVPRAELPETIRRLARALKAGGIFYMSFQSGEGERVEPDGRLFTNFTLVALRQMIDGIGGLDAIHIWEMDVEGATQRKRWLHALARWT